MNQAEARARLEEAMVEIPEWAKGLFPTDPGHGFVHRPIEGIPYRYEYVHEQNKLRRLRVLCTARVEADGKRWMHVSFSKPRELPSWSDASLVKRVFVGDERKAIQIMPPASEHISDHTYCLHWWSCLDEDPLPDFRYKGSI